VVSDAGGDLPTTAHIVAGRYSIKERYTLRPASFPIIRGGLRVGYFERDPQRHLEGGVTAGKVTGIAIDYFEQSLLDGFGITIGLDLITDRTLDSLQLQSMALRIGGMARLPLVPEVLYLRPTGSIGYAQPHQAYGLNGQLLLQGQMDLSLCLGLLDLSAGIRYTHLLTDPGFNGIYAIGSLGVDLYRFIPATYKRDAPGLRGILKNLSLR